MMVRLFPLLTFSLLLTTCAMSDHEGLTHEVVKIQSPIAVNAEWNKPPWNSIQPISLDHFMGEKPSHFPQVEAKVAYESAALYVIFRVQDQYVRAVRNRHQEGVFKDSCVEFFFSPAKNSDKGYFNLEMNCGGTMLFHHQKEPRKGSVNISDEDIDKIVVAHSLPSIVDPEIQEPTTWTVEYRIPFEILEKYHDMIPPTTGTIWRSNFYKCADETSHPHWLTWSPIDFPRPNFHLPAFFGTLKFM